MPFLVICGGIFMVLAMAVFAFSGPSAARAGSRRLDALRERHNGDRRRSRSRTRADARRTCSRRSPTAPRCGCCPTSRRSQKRLAMTGKTWTAGQYGKVSAGLFARRRWRRCGSRALPLLLAALVGVMLGAGIPHFVVNWTIKRRINKFTVKVSRRHRPAGPRPALGSADLGDDRGRRRRSRRTGRRGIPPDLRPDEDRPDDGSRDAGNRRPAGHARIPVLRDHHRDPA